MENPGAKSLAKAFINMPNLRKIAIPQNGIRTPGVKAMAAAVCQCKSLRILNLNDNTFTSKAMIPMARSIANLTHIEEIDFGDCLVRTRGVQAFTEVLKENEFPDLKRIDISEGEVKRDALVAFCRALNVKQFNGPIAVNVNGNNLGAAGIKSVKSCTNINLENSDFEDDYGTPENSEDSESEGEDAGTEEEIDVAEQRIKYADESHVVEQAEKCTVAEFLDKPTG